MKYFLEVELPDNDYCEGCPRLNEDLHSCQELNIRLGYESHKKMSGMCIDHIKHDKCPLKEKIR